MSENDSTKFKFVENQEPFYKNVNQNYKLLKKRLKTYHKYPRIRLILDCIERFQNHQNYTNFYTPQH